MAAGGGGRRSRLFEPSISPEGAIRLRRLRLLLLRQQALLLEALLQQICHLHLMEVLDSRLRREAHHQARAARAHTPTRLHACTLHMIRRAASVTQKHQIPDFAWPRTVVAGVGGSTRRGAPDPAGRRRCWGWTGGERTALANYTPPTPSGAVLHSYLKLESPCELCGAWMRVGGSWITRPRSLLFPLPSLVFLNPKPAILARTDRPLFAGDHSLT